jgi:hypothetical protein
MSECHNFAVRDRLPEYAHDALEDETELAMIRAHLDLCETCADELAIIEATLATAPQPKIDVAKIVAAIPPYRPPEVSVPVAGARGRAERRWFGAVNGTAFRMAAGFLIAAAGLSAVMVSHHGTSAPAAAAGVALVNVSELSDDNLEQLINSMDNLDGTPPSEPEVVPSAVAEGAI